VTLFEFIARYTFKHPQDLEVVVVGSEFGSCKDLDCFPLCQDGVSTEPDCTVSTMTELVEDFVAFFWPERVTEHDWMETTWAIAVGILNVAVNKAITVAFKAGLGS
jgi:hypothetical protein